HQVVGVIDERHLRLWQLLSVPPHHHRSVIAGLVARNQDEHRYVACREPIDAAFQAGTQLAQVAVNVRHADDKLLRDGTPRISTQTGASRLYDEVVQEPLPLRRGWPYRSAEGHPKQPLRSQ